LRLARDPRDIRLGDVVRTTEPDMALVPCLELTGSDCAILPECKLRTALQRATAAFLEVLDGYTLADLVSNRDQLAALLAPEPDEVEVAAG